MRSILLILLLAAAIGARAQEQEETVITSVVVPVVGSVLGPNAVIWKTDVELVNDFPSDTTVSLMLPTAPEQPVIVTTLGPGGRVRFADVVGEAFGMDAVLSPLLVKTLGRRSISIRATVYGLRDGKLIPPQPIPIDYGPSYFPQRVLDGLSFNDARRTNVGLANLGEQPAEFTLALQRLPGRNLAISRVVLPPSSLWHDAVQAMFPMITKGDDFTVVVETSSRETHVYASVIENETSSAKFVRARVGSATVATRP
jgi:hypothetical protein